MTTLLQRIQENDLASLSEWEVAERLNTPDPNLPPKESTIRNADVMAVLIANNLWANILDKASNSQDAHYQLCINIRDSVTVRDYIFDLNDPVIKTSFESMLTQAVNGGLIPQNVATLLGSMGYRYQSWAEYNNIEVTARTVGIARGGIA